MNTLLQNQRSKNLPTHPKRIPKTEKRSRVNCLRREFHL